MAKNIKFKTVAKSELLAGITDQDSSLSVPLGHGDRFPAVTAPEYFYLTLRQADAREVVKITSRSAGSDSMTIGDRALEGTLAQNWAAGTLIGLRLTAGSMEDILDAIPDNASELAFTPTGGISATTTQAAIAELDSEFRAHDHDGVYEPANANLAKLNADQSWSGSQRATPVTDNDGSFDMNAGNDFVCTPAAGVTLQFTNETAGQRGCILLVNTDGRSISLGAEIKAPAGLAAAITAAGTYWLSYWCHDGANVSLVASGGLS